MGKQEWYTPPEILDMVVDCMGKIDLDPCANPQKTVPAITHFVGGQENGLAKSWGHSILVPNSKDGEVLIQWRKPYTLFLNPPWGRLSEWVMHTVTEYSKGHYSEAIMLVPCAIETKWFQRLRYWPVCFPNKRINYIEETESGLKLKNGFDRPSCLIHIGSNHDRFEQVFGGEFGRIYYPKEQSNE